MSTEEEVGGEDAGSLEPLSPVIPADYGDVGSEYRALREAVGLVERLDLVVLRMWGRDPKKMVNGLITNDIARLTPERVVYAAMLTPKGRMISDLRILEAGAGGSDLLLIIPAAAATAVREHLRKYVPPLFARWEDVTDMFTLASVIGPRAGSVVECLLGASAPSEVDGVARGSRDGEPIVAIGEPSGPVEGHLLVIPESIASATVSGVRERVTDAGGSEVGFSAFETLRIETGVPRFGREMTDENLPAEAYQSTGMMDRAISFTKGCYTGQEVVVRIAHRGHVNRHLRGFLLGDADSAIEHPLFHPDTGREVGRTTSTTRSPLLGETIALGYVRREFAPGDQVRIGSPEGTTGQVTELPFEGR